MPMTEAQKKMWLDPTAKYHPGPKKGGDGDRDRKGEIRPPTPEEVAKIEAGPRYAGWPKPDPPSTLAPPTAWATPGEPLSAWDQFLQSLQEGWPWQREDPALVDWRERVAAMQAQGQAPALSPAPVIPELGMEAWAGRLPAWPERGRLPGVEMALTGNIGRWGQEFSAETPVVLPEGFEVPTDDPELLWQRYDWAKTIAYDETLFNPETGEQLTWDQAARLARTNPGMMIVDVFAIGGGNTIEVDMTLNDLFTGRPREEIEVLLRGEGEAIETKVTEQMEALMEERKAEILDSDKSFAEKLKAVLDLYGDTSGNPEVYRKLKAEVIASLSPEEREQREREKTEGVPPIKSERKEPVTAKVDIGALQETLAPYGINLIGNYPYISPITEAHLMRLSPDVIEQMQRYLSEKGLSWRDFLEISSSWYGGGGQGGRGQWNIPRQW